MIKVPLGRSDLIALIDDKDADLLRLGSWSAHISKSGAYACCRIKGTRTWMHTTILEDMLGRPLKKGELADHINGDKLDNRRANLRLANRSQNNANKPARKGLSSKYKGVSWDKNKEKWRAYIQINKKLKHIGYFGDEQQAAIAYNREAKRLYGEFAIMNKVNGVNLAQ